MPFDRNSALIVIDVQNAMDSPVWSGRNNPDLLANLAAVLACWREFRWPIYHVAHDSRFPDSPYRPGQPGNEFKLEVRPLAGEYVIRKNTCSAFASSDLESRLRAAGHLTLVVGGIVTNNSVEATVRAAGDLGFDVYVLADGTATVGRTDRRGHSWDAEDVHQLALANMDGEYARIIEVRELLREVHGRG